MLFLRTAQLEESALEENESTQQLSPCAHLQSYMPCHMILLGRDATFTSCALDDLHMHWQHFPLDLLGKRVKHLLHAGCASVTQAVPALLPPAQQQAPSSPGAPRPTQLRVGMQHTEDTSSSS